MQQPKNDVFQMLKLWIESYQAQNNTLPLINLSIGNPDLTPDSYWLERLSYYVQNPHLHGYGDQSPAITHQLRSEFIRYFNRRFLESNQQHWLDSTRHVVELSGSKEAIFLSLFALTESGDTVLMPDPSYAVYYTCAEQVKAKVELFPTDPLTGQPLLEALSPEQLQRAKLLILCSPNNPTAVFLNPTTLAKALALAEQYNFFIILDRAYAEIQFHSQTNSTHLTGSLLSHPKALHRVIELHSLSKSASLAGWRVGFAVGAESIIQSLKALKFSTSFGIFLPIQQTVIELLGHLESIAYHNNQVYYNRMVQFKQNLAKAGWNLQTPQGTFFIWTPLPPQLSHLSDIEFSQKLLNEAGVLVSPGSGFGSSGKGYVRIALVQNSALLEAASERIQHWLLSQSVTSGS